MSFSDFAKRVRAAASERGVSLAMAKLNDAIALACYGKKYPAAVAAEKSDRLPPLPNPPPYIAQVAQHYRMDAHAFGLALHEALAEPHESFSGEVLEKAMVWTEHFYPGLGEKLREKELYGLADDSAFAQFDAPERMAQLVDQYCEWFVAEGTLKIHGAERRVADLLLSAPNRPDLTPRERAYVRAVAGADLRLYLVDKVDPGFALTLRPVSPPGDRLIVVRERSASSPSLVGCYVAARVIPRDGHYELTVIYPYSLQMGGQLAVDLRATKSPKSRSRKLRAAYLQQFDRPLPTVVLAGSGDRALAVTDHYKVIAVEAFVQALESCSELEGTIDLGWTRARRESDGRTRSICSIHFDPETAAVSAFYLSQERADEGRPWFEALTGATVHFQRREAIDPMEAALQLPPGDLAGSVQVHSERTEREAGEAGMRGNAGPGQLHAFGASDGTIRISGAEMTTLLAQGYRQHYANFADTPVPMLDGLSPRAMLKKPKGESRVRELLGLYEANERRMAHQQRRPEIEFGFLYEALGLDRVARSVDRPPGVYPDQFQVNDAWLVFPLLDEPIVTKDQPPMRFVGLMDGASTYMLGYAYFEDGSTLDKHTAARLLTSPETQRHSEPARVLIVEMSLSSTGLEQAASDLGMTVVRMPLEDMRPVVGHAMDQLGEHLHKRMQGD